MWRLVRRAFVGVVFLPACSAVPFPEYERIGALEEGASSSAPLPRPLEEPTRYVERVLLQRSGVETAWTVYGRILPPDGVEITGVSDFGTTVFVVVGTPGSLRCRQRAPSIPEGLLETLLEDQLSLLLVPPAAAVSIVRLADGGEAFRWRQGPRDVLLCEDTPGRWALVKVGVNGQLGATLEVDEWSRDAEGRAGHPVRYSVNGLAGGYRATCEMVDWRPAALQTEAPREESRGSS